MTRAKLVLIMCKLQDYYFGLSGIKGTAETISIQDVLSAMVEYIAEPTRDKRKCVEETICKFLNIFEGGKTDENN